ncbi:MAG: RagB/SusD family nutrient uptake outer membrane protein, partial [Chitinophagaceae bacterium]|nr:RagB/SusD family nutrient uptake outer membrane protein [Chitinophagaceae bacterium]
ANSLKAFNGGVTVYAGLSSDELISNTNSLDDRLAYTNSFLSTSTVPLFFWSGAYPIIYKANACIEGITKSKSIGENTKNQLIGEAKFVRSFLYFNLVNLFGDVPLVFTTDFEANALLPRTPVSTVLQKIATDLEEARDLLPAEYVTPGRVRVNKFSATALLAKIYLYQKDWSNAKLAASQVIDKNDTYQLETDLNNVFLPTSREAILQLLPVSPTYNTAEGFLFVATSSTATPKYIVSDYLLNAFEANDSRKISGNWLMLNTTSGGQDYYYPYKYKLGRDGSSSPSEYYTVLRLADQYLIRAEANAQLNSLQDAEDDLNVIRTRAGLSDTTITDQDGLLNAVLKERQVELFCEWGNRWYDLKRTDKVNEVMSVVTPLKGGVWNNNLQLYPVPQTQIETNPFLIQNPGYQ